MAAMVSIGAVSSRPAYLFGFRSFAMLICNACCAVVLVSLTRAVFLYLSPPLLFSNTTSRL